MSQPPARQALQQRVAAAILEGAAEVLAEHGEQASMSAVAAASGVARATVYRYFPNREALLAELGHLAVGRADSALASARVEEVPPLEGVRRAVRALIEVGDPFVAVARDRARPDRGEFERRLAEPLTRLFERGQQTGTIRADIPSAWLTESLVGLVVSVLGARPALGRDDTIDLVTGLFLDGAAA
jgi:TetR/AcrR family transcriptional regulator, mexCD-oprJ operon repressor